VGLHLQLGELRRFRHRGEGRLAPRLDEPADMMSFAASSAEIGSSTTSSAAMMKKIPVVEERAVERRREMIGHESLGLSARARQDASSRRRLKDEHHRS
jgi:hypothetical protein